MTRKAGTELKLKVAAAAKRSRVIGECLLGLDQKQEVRTTLSFDPGPGPQPETLCWVVPDLCQEAPKPGKAMTIRVSDLVRAQQELTNYLKKLQRQVARA